MWFEVMRETEQRVYSSRGLKLQSGYALLPFQTPGSFSALVGIHLKKEKSCLKKGPTSEIAKAICLLADKKLNEKKKIKT